MSNAQRRLLIAAGVGAAALVLALALGEQLREAVVTPILYVVWAVGGFLGSFPQAIYWAVFITAALALALGSLHTRIQISQPGPYTAEKAALSHVMILSRRVRDAELGAYFRRRLARHLLNLTLQAKGYHEVLSSQETRTLLQSGRLRLPAGGTTYLESYLAQDNDQRWGLLDRLRLRLRDAFFPDWNNTPYDPHLIELIDHLEKELEITHHDHHD